MDHIVLALEEFLAGSAVGTVHFPDGNRPPPDLAYLVNFPRISITLKGIDRMEWDSLDFPGEVEVPVGQAVAIPPNRWNRPSWSGKATVLNILVGQKQLGLSLTSLNGDSKGPPKSEKATVPTEINLAERHLVQALLDVGMRHQPSAAPSILNALLQCLLENFRRPDAFSGKLSSAYEAITLYLQQNFAFPLTRESVADHFHLSPGHVSRLFRQEGLTGFNEYLNRVRIDRAKFLLRKHSLTLEEIARRCGYSDSAYFCRVFKRFTKQTPKGYQGL